MGHIRDGFYGSNDPTNSVKALKEEQICEFLFVHLYDILCVLCLLLCTFVHFMPFIVYVCTALLPLGVINDNNSTTSTNGFC